VKYIANGKFRRYSSPIIPVRVGPHAETFPVHKDILTKSEYFRKALDGEFREAEDQAIDLPEEDPDIFSFVIAFLYEEKFVPIKPMAMALGEQHVFQLKPKIANMPGVAEPDKGKGREIEDTNSGSEDGSDSGGSASDERYVVLFLVTPPCTC
jgi:BTB/POZ domain